MKKFLRTLVFLALAAALVALVVLGRSNHALRRKVRELGSEIRQLEQERRDLQQKVSAAQRGPKPEERTLDRQQIEQQTSELRGLPFKNPVQYKMIERTELRRVLVEKVKEQYTEQEMRDYNRTLATMGLVPEGTDLLNVIVSLYNEQVAAFYVPEERALYTFKDLVFSSNLDKMLLSHELTHALQDQNFDLQKFPLKIKDNDDLALATSALVEGDATVLMTRWYVENIDPSKMLGDLGAMLNQNTAKLREAPPYLREMLLFPYQQGQQFAMTVYMSGGIGAIDAAFRNPPTCTKDILHPEKYLRRPATPEHLDLPRLESKDWRLVGNNVLGEFGTDFILQQAMGAYDAQMLAQGWNGDRYQVYERGTNGPTALVWATAWEDEQQAGEFEGAYKKVIEKRGSPVASLHIHRDGKHVTIVQSPDAAFLDSWEAAHPTRKTN
jgi:outer membrane murein-binding lipoprotein Lpp